MTDRFDQIAEILQAQRAESFAPYFSDRVMRRVRGDAASEKTSSVSLYDTLQWAFVRAAFVCLLLIVGVGILNVVQFGASDGVTLVEALLGLPPDALADMLTYNLI